MTNATASFTVASFNVKGGANTPYGSWKTRLPKVVKTMLKAHANVYFLQEASKSQKVAQQILAELKKQSGKSTWTLILGRDAEHIIIDSSVKPVRPATDVDIHDGRDYVELNLWHKATGVRFWVWTTHLIAAGKDRPTPVAAEMRRAEAGRIVTHLKRLHRCIGGGDINSDHTEPGSLASIFSDAGHIEVRDLVDTVENGAYDSNDDFLPNTMSGLWLDRLFAGSLCVVRRVGLIDSGTASDHNLIWASVSITGPVTKF